jgi:hypothetical protein
MATSSLKKEAICVLNEEDDEEEDEPGMTEEGEEAEEEEEKTPPPAVCCWELFSFSWLYCRQRSKWLSEKTEIKSNNERTMAESSMFPCSLDEPQKKSKKEKKKKIVRE